MDTHLFQGYKVPPYYDSLLAKVIAHGPNRLEAIKRMIRALDELVVEGVHTTAPFLKRILQSETFRSGKYSTQFIEKHMQGNKNKDDAKSKDKS